MCVCVCVFVFVFVFVCKHISGTTHPIFAHFTYVRGSGVVLKKEVGGRLKRDLDKNSYTAFQ